MQKTTTTLPQPISLFTEEKLTYLQEGFPANHSQRQEKGGGTDDYRYLWPSMCKAIATFRPTWVVGENVTGILSMADEYNVWKEVFFRVDNRNIARLQEVDKYEAIYTRQEKMLLHSIVKDLEKIGYSVQVFTIPAAATGAPHKRDRVWIVAHTASNGHGQFQFGKTGQTEGEDKGQEDQRQRVWNELGGNGLKEVVTNTQYHGLSASEGRGGYGETGQGTQEGENGPKQFKGVCESQELGGLRNVANSTYGGGRERSGRLRNKEQEAGTPKSHEPPEKQFGIPDEKGNATNATGPGRGQDNGRGKSEQFNQNSTPGGWQNFPTQSPVCSRNDGVPPKLDGITLSAWRNQSIKGYGNAIVPQVAIEIYKAIQQEYDKYN